ncbi:MAG: hypothetical protein H7039_24680 [Bryobacteraceae bacterium]|nr:hypothetical protein [Bryobacteraceae bacterium]
MRRTRSIRLQTHPALGSVRIRALHGLYGKQTAETQEAHQGQKKNDDLGCGEYLKRTVAPLVSWDYNPAKEVKLGSFGQMNLFEDTPMPEAPEGPPISIPEAA